MLSRSAPFRRLSLQCVVGALLFVGRSEAQPAPDSANESAAPAGLRGSFSTALERAVIDYESGNYEGCVDAFRSLLPSAPSAAATATARTYLAACLVALGRLDEARVQFREAILADRQLQPPDPVVFPGAVVDLFVQVRGELMATLRQQQQEELERGRARAEALRRDQERERLRVRELERLVASETLVRRNERWMAWVPYGIGQFHNDDEVLGWVLLTTEFALTVAAISATSVELNLHSRAEGGNSTLDDRDLTRSVRAARAVGTISWTSLALLAAAGVVEANLSFRPEVVLGERRRELPPSLLPSEDREEGAPAPQGGAWFGLSGRF